MDSGQVIARFVAERQALAMMDYAIIAKVFEAGTTDSGRPQAEYSLLQQSSGFEPGDKKEWVSVYEISGKTRRSVLLPLPPMPGCDRIKFRAP